jgi:hypothetical protein
VQGPITFTENRSAVRKAKGNVPLEILSFIQEDNIALDPKEVGWDGLERINLSQGRDKKQAVLNTVTKLRIS